MGHATGGIPIESEFSKDGVYKVISIGSYSTDNTYHDQGIRAIKSEKTKSRLLNKNDLTMILNDKTTIEKNIIGRTLLIEESGVYVYNQRTERIELDITQFDPSFIYEELNAPHIRQKIIAQSQGNTQVYVNWSSISQLVYSIPSLSEQQKIGSFFRKLDDLLALHQRQTQKLTELKQGLLHEMFPREGESVPRLRFPGFTTHWKQKQFNDVYTSFPNKMYQVQTSEYHAEGKFIVIDQGTNDIAGYTNREDKVCHQFPCIIFGDHTTNIKYVNEPFVVGADGVKTLKATGDCAFASYNLKVNNVTQQGYKRHFSQLKEINVLCPSPAEQQKIGSFFHTLDDRIHCHEQYTVKLVELKKGLLQKMFPQD